MTVYSLNTLTDEQFALALRDELWARDLNALTAVVRAGKKAYEKLLLPSEDGPHTILPAVGWIRLGLDESLDPWSAIIAIREDVDGRES